MEAILRFFPGSSITQSSKVKKCHTHTYTCWSRGSDWDTAFYQFTLSWVKKVIESCWFWVEFFVVLFFYCCGVNFLWLLLHHHSRMKGWLILSSHTWFVFVFSKKKKPNPSPSYLGCIIQFSSLFKTELLPVVRISSSHSYQGNDSYYNIRD